MSNKGGRVSPDYLADIAPEYAHYEKRSKLKKRLPARVKGPLVIPSESNDTWSIDFVSDRLQSGRSFRVLNIIDDCDRVAIGQEISMSMPAERVIKLL